MYLVVVAMAIDWRGGIGARDGMQGHDDLMSGTKKRCGTRPGYGEYVLRAPDLNGRCLDVLCGVRMCEFGMNWTATSGRGESCRRLRLKSGWRSNRGANSDTLFHQPPTGVPVEIWLVPDSRRCRVLVEKSVT